MPDDAMEAWQMKARPKFYVACALGLVCSVLWVGGAEVLIHGHRVLGQVLIQVGVLLSLVGIALLARMLSARPKEH